VLGLAPGGREDDFTASGAAFSGRGLRFEQILDELRRIWDGEPRGTAGAIGPTPLKGQPPIIIGGQVDKAFERAARHGEGWIAGGAPPEYFRPAAEQAKAAWSAHGRSGQPRLMALGYFALGPDAGRHASNYLRDYYAFLGPMAADIGEAALTDGSAVRGAVTAFAEAGADELILFPADPDPAQVDLLADALRS
jgi:alkanesulfonate monooxygenase SsuD/methylene tetrahydromethanopterin reductase-like flavin-dependent oxidoreductase (luciferase family)